MAPVKSVCQTDDRDKSSDLQIPLRIQTGFHDDILVLRKILLDIPGRQSDDLPLRVRETDDLVAHDDIPGILADLVEADKLSNVMKHNSDPEHQPVPSGHARQRKCRIKKAHGRHIHIVDVRSADRVADGDILRAGYNIVFKIMLCLEDIVCFRELIGETSLQMCARRPDVHGIQVRYDLVINDGGRPEQGRVLHCDIILHRKVGHRFTADPPVPLLELIPCQNTRRAVSVLRILENHLCDEVAVQNNVLNLQIPDIHAAEQIEIMLNQLLDQILIIVCPAHGILKFFPDTEISDLHVLCDDQLGFVKNRDLNTSSVQIDDSGSLADHVLEASRNGGNRLVAQEPLLRVAQNPDIQSCRLADLAQNEQIIFRLADRARRNRAVTIHLIGVHDLPKIRQDITELIDHFKADPSGGKRIMAKLNLVRYLIDTMNTVFPGDFKNLKRNLIASDVDCAEC